MPAYAVQLYTSPRGLLLLVVVAALLLLLLVVLMLGVLVSVMGSC
jgi:hypothetical protein